MSTNDDERPKEQAALQSARIAAAHYDRKILLRTFYEQILCSLGATEIHRFSSVITWAIQFMGEDSLVDGFSCSHSILRGFAEGKLTPGPGARATLLETLKELIEVDLDQA
jgi:hypothetical protein